MNQQFQGPRRPQTIFNDYKYDMPKSTEPVSGQKFKARWTWELGNNGKVYFKIQDGAYGRDDPNAKNKEIELSFFERDALFAVLEEACANKDFKMQQVQIRDKLYNQQMRKWNEEASIEATFTVRKEENGEIRVAYARGTYKVNFVFNHEHLLVMTKDASGNAAASVEIASRIYTRSFISFSRKFLDLHEWDKYKRPESKNGNNNNNNNNKNGNNNNNNNSNAMPDFDDDIDF